MKFCIDEEVCEKLGLPLPHLLLLMLITQCDNIDSLIKEALDKEYIVSVDSKYMLTQRWSEVMQDILLTSDKAVPKEERTQALAKKLIELFPKGKKEGTNTYWRGNPRDISLKLKKFFKLYGEQWTDEQILTATKKYVESFNGNYEYMRVLKYFIHKDVRKLDEEGNCYIEPTSELASCLSNIGQEDLDSTDFTTTLR